MLHVASYKATNLKLVTCNQQPVTRFNYRNQTNYSLDVTLSNVIVSLSNYCRTIVEGFRSNEAQTGLCF